MAENKSVIEHLEDIEESLKPKEYKPQTISDMIGEPFDPYMDSSTVYYFEPDERKFNKHKKKQCNSLTILAVVYLLPLLEHLILSFIFKTNLFWLFMGDLLLLLCPIFYLIYGFKQKSKKIANSKWNLKNHVFYKYEDKLGSEDNKGLLAKLLLVYKIISLLLFALSAVPILLGGYDDTLKAIIGRGKYIFALAAILPLHINMSFSYYRYPAYIFDNEKSYVLYQYGTWKKFEK